MARTYWGAIENTEMSNQSVFSIIVKAISLMEDLSGQILKEPKLKPIVCIFLQNIFDMRSGVKVLYTFYNLVHARNGSK